MEQDRNPDASLEGVAVEPEAPARTLSSSIELTGARAQPGPSAALGQDDTGAVHSQAGASVDAPAPLQQTVGDAMPDIAASISFSTKEERSFSVDIHASTELVGAPVRGPVDQ